MSRKDEFEMEIARRQEAFDALEGDDFVEGDLEDIAEQRRIFRPGMDEIESVARLRGQVKTADDLAFKAALRHAKHEDLSGQAQFTRTNPVSILKGSLGNQQNCRVGETLPVANWAGDDAETIPITVTFAPVDALPNIASGGSAHRYRPFGIATFGTRGFSATITADIGRGCQFTVSGSSMVLQVGVEQDPNLPGLIADSNPLGLFGEISFRPIVRTERITRTRYFHNVSTGFALVPAFAKSITVWRSEPNSYLRVTFTDIVNDLIYTVDYPNYQFPTEPIPIGGDIITVEWATFSANPDTGGAPVSVRADMIFNLCC